MTGNLNASGGGEPERCRSVAAEGPHKATRPQGTDGAPGARRVLAWLIIERNSALPVALARADAISIIFEQLGRVAEKWAHQVFFASFTSFQQDVRGGAPREFDTRRSASQALLPEDKRT